MSTKTILRWNEGVAPLLSGHSSLSPAVGIHCRLFLGSLKNHSQLRLPEIGVEQKRFAEPLLILAPSRTYNQWWLEHAFNLLLPFLLTPFGKVLPCSLTKLYLKGFLLCILKGP